jgi:hypothetical protein
MKFAVETAPVQITDPETKEVLGEYSESRVIVEPDRIFENFTVASQPTRLISRMTRSLTGQT